MQSSLIFGDESKFAIRYSECSVEYNYDHESKRAILHMVLNNTTVGNQFEECYLPTWYYKVVKFRNFLDQNRDSLYPEQFRGFDDRQIFELILKSNQLSDDFDKYFLELPQLDNLIWLRHHLSLDETIDAFTTCFYVRDNIITVIIENWWPKENNLNRSNILISKVDLDYFLRTLEEATEFLKSKYSYLQ